MPRVKKPHQVLNIKIDINLAEKMDKFISETGLTKTATVERALKQYFEKYDQTGKI